ncbi:TIGR00730 family Rossman fold protein [Patescibacteria group bacterium]|nr:TIGR00730 family Rossman fold protein [Patescibacteria group bacterium]MBU1721390.1 TIGR00730 family Rossman fold protein [Patescibacteria group bacterium]MBU1901830.1 TIGR00730 family Rossman fold protein [Patescibacteria group bacterium]
MKEETIKKVKQDEDKDYTYHINETGDYREAWRIFRIMSEFVEGYSFLNSLKKEVTILGSARLAEDHKYGKMARDLGKLLAEHGYTTITGGGPGIMEAANHGAYDGKGVSVGLNIQLPFEQRINPYVNKSTAFYYFFTRKVMLTSPANAFVYFPGGFGTFDEFFEVVDHMELGKMCRVPIILVGKEFWSPVLEFLNTTCFDVGSIAGDESKNWHLVDSAEEAMEIIEQNKDNKQVCELSPMDVHHGSNVDWKVFRIMAELVEGFEFLTGLIEDVTILGTKSISKTSPYYVAAEQLGKRFAEDGYAVVTGGAEGTAEAANKGAHSVGGQSIGIGMDVRGKARMNEYVNKSIMCSFPFTRKLLVTAPSKGFVFFPGGLGTMHQLAEILTLIQTGKMERIPVILYDRAFWAPLVEYIKTMLVDKYQTISLEDMDIFTVIDSVDEAVNIINGFRNK